MCQGASKDSHSSAEYGQKMNETNCAAAACTLDRYALAVCSDAPVNLWALGRRHDPTRVVYVTKQTSIFVFSQMDNFLTHAHALSESSCTAVQKNTNAAC